MGKRLTMVSAAAPTAPHGISSANERPMLTSLPVDCLSSLRNGCQLRDKAMMLLLASVVVSFAICDASAEDVKLVGSGVESVFDRGLIKEKVTWKNIVKYQNAYSTAIDRNMNISGDVLAYVTPWNNHGYDVAKLHGQKFTYVSPVWLQLKYERNTGFALEGTHDIDSGWMAEVKKKKAKIVPRLIFEDWSLREIDELSSSPDKLINLGNMLHKFARDNNFDGYVLELWNRYSAGGKLANSLSVIVRTLWPPLAMFDLALILVIPPPLHDDTVYKVFTRTHFENLKRYVTAFSMMTYDYSSALRPGPNAPIEWMRKCVEYLVPKEGNEDYEAMHDRHKIMLGLNFYGYDYTAQGGSSPILGKQFSDMLQKYKPKISWSDQFAEHYVNIRGSDGHHTVFFPTLKSISARIELAQELGTSLSIWEIGQGMDYFYDLL
ncbi:chitinase domain-containing protein 1-like [Tropilaelaps mercedesae]|uniref:Chitinase domain-containing protein 1 n=1 Tax=Tropilaelaps mercedesae TaxID=418985 RepID=A0A1V9XW04_9ACAR|nr:chitinase domain-containing protein 1-like [Tropilaelaps mercedesae]